MGKTRSRAAEKKNESSKNNSSYEESYSNSFSRDNSPVEESLEKIRGKIKANFEFSNEIEIIFKEVYSFYFNTGYNHSRSTPIEHDIQKYEKFISIKITQEKDLLPVFFKALYQNISGYIKIFKDKILALNNNKQVRDRYNELKKIITTSMSSNATPEQKAKTEIIYTNEILLFCNTYKVQIVNIIKDLNKVYEAIIKSSTVFDGIFHMPLSLIKDDYELQLKTKNLHKEEFFNAIINDDFIKALIIEVKNKDIPSFVKLREDIKEIEEDISNCCKDMKRLKELFNKKHFQMEEKFEDETLIDLKDVKTLNQYIINAAKYINNFLIILEKIKKVKLAKICTVL